MSTAGLPITKSTVPISDSDSKSLIDIRSLHCCYNEYDTSSSNIIYSLETISMFSSGVLKISSSLTSITERLYFQKQIFSIYQFVFAIWCQCSICTATSKVFLAFFINILIFQKYIQLSVPYLRKWFLLRSFS